MYILTAVFISITAVGLGAYCLIITKPPTDYPILAQQLEETYSEQRLTDNVIELRMHYDRLWSCFKACERGRQAAIQANQTFFRGLMILSAVNIYLLAMAYKKQ